MVTTLMELEPERRDALLNAALDEFAARGYAAASTNVIARKAGMSKPLMFHYVGSKRELFLVVREFFYEVLVRDYVEKMDCGTCDVIARLRQSFLLQIALVSRYPSILALETLSAPTGDQGLDRELAEQGAAWSSACVPLFDGVNETLFRTDLCEGVGMRLVRWAAEGFAAHLLEAAQGEGGLDVERVSAEVEGFAADLRRALYRDAEGVR